MRIPEIAGPKIIETWKKIELRLIAFASLFLSTRFGIKACLAGILNERMVAEIAVITKISNGAIIFVKEAYARIPENTESNRVVK